MLDHIRGERLGSGRANKSGRNERRVRRKEQMMPNTVRFHRVLRAPPERVYRAFLDADAMANAHHFDTTRKVPLHDRATE